MDRGVSPMGWSFREMVAWDGVDMTLTASWPFGSGGGGGAAAGSLKAQATCRAAASASGTGRNWRPFMVSPR